MRERWQQRGGWASTRRWTGCVRSLIIGLVLIAAGLALMTPDRTRPGPPILLPVALLSRAK